MVALILVLVLVLVLVLANTTYSSSTSSKKQQHLLACDLIDYLGGETRSNRTNSGVNDLINDGSILSTEDTCQHGHDVCRDTGNSTSSRLRGRVVVIGDVHGSYEGLLELLYYSNITASEKSCRWREQAYTGTRFRRVILALSFNQEAAAASVTLSDASSLLTALQGRFWCRSVTWSIEGRRAGRHTRV